MTEDLQLRGMSERTQEMYASESVLQDGAEGGIRTRTGLLPLDPEPSASASSATSAKKDQSLKI